ncbi:hypothetical protein EV578_102578 [Streptomyces sp. BK205]|uniref:Uncharacterized protein n=1 Tax=Streptomyces griseorubiginosus TaxID=67304 RepID=A0AAI8L011_9ACTN|nr:hypothetical protein DWG14_03114 [Streptomyces griseorubiginosus]TCR25346.1 hypothetical protein EV578_102578 [Streptomyces sp. BK205]
MPGTGSSTILPAVEQRIGSSSQPLEGAGFDPAYIPGLTSPVSGEAESAPEKAEVTAEEAVEKPAEESTEEPTGEPAEEAADGPAEEVAPDGPVFEASDRRARVVADHQGVRLSLDDQACEFRWDEIGAIETETPRFGKRYTITVHTPDRRWYPIEIEAKSRSSFEEWDAQIDAVLDAYFEDETPQAEEEESEETP